MSPLAGSCEIIDVPDHSRGFDYHCSLLSLPLAFQTNLDTIPCEVPYLAARDELILKWKARIGEGGLRIGICWQGSLARVDSGRSFPLRAFEGLSRIPGVRLISLHRGAGEAQLRDMPAGMSVETLGDDFDAGPDAFLDAAAAMRCCDLVITSDTAIAHLAGALGVKTWVALRQVPDWRWMMDRADSPWYPTLRLFRQPSHDDWRGVFAQMEQSLLQELASEGRA